MKVEMIGVGPILVFCFKNWSKQFFKLKNSNLAGQVLVSEIGMVVASVKNRQNTIKNAKV